MLRHSLGCDLENRPDLITRNGRKILQEVIDSISGLKALEERGNWHPRAREARGSGKYLGITCHGALKINHGSPLVIHSAKAACGRGPLRCPGTVTTNASSPKPLSGFRAFHEHEAALLLGGRNNFLAGFWIDVSLAGAA